MMLEMAHFSSGGVAATLAPERDACQQPPDAPFMEDQKLVSVLHAALSKLVL